MFQISVAQLFEDNRERLGLAWVTQPSATPALIRRDTQDSAALVGHINLIHPNRLQVLGAPEAARLTQDNADGAKLIAELLAPSPAIVIVGDDAQADAGLIQAASHASVALLRSTASSALVIDTLRRYFARKLAETTSLHGVCMDVLGLGVLITGESGVGKSELALELISRGHGLVADDVVEISHIGLGTLEARCPPMLKDFLEVRGLGMLNIRTIFGETAVRPRMRLRLVVNLLRPSQTQSFETERLPLHELSEDILGVTVRKVVIPVAAGRNLAVLLEAAVRNYILQLRGIHSTAEFVQRQQEVLQGNAMTERRDGQ